MIDIRRTRKLWKLLEDALTHLRKCEKQKLKYAINMNVWMLQYKGKCFLCLGGACLVGHHINYDDVEPNSPLGCRLQAINQLRKGDVLAALYWMYNTEGTSVLNRDIIDYKDGPKRWHEQMDQLLAELKADNV